MAREGDDPLKKLGLDTDDTGKIELGVRSGEPGVPQFDPGAAAALKAIAKQLGVPVERFYRAPDSTGPEAKVSEADRHEQEQRLLNAFRRLADPTLRQSLVELAETLRPEP